MDPSITLTQFPDSILASPSQQPSAYFFIEFTPMFNDLTATDHACITPRRIDLASALPGSAVGRHLTAGRAGALRGGAPELSTGGAGVGRLQVLARGGAGRRGGVDRRAHAGVRAAADVPGCATGVGGGCGRCRRWVRPGTHAGVGWLGGGEVGCDMRAVLARSGRMCGRVWGHEALFE
jgi:hypothetical protein